MSQARISTSVDGQRLKELRVRIGWTQQIAAQKSGYTERLIRKLESGGPVALQTLDDVVATYREHVADANDRDLGQYVAGRSLDQRAEIASDALNAIFNDDDLKLLDSILAADVTVFVENSSKRGRAAALAHYRRALEAFEQIEFSVDHVVSRNGEIAVFWSMRMKHARNYHGISASERRIAANGCTLMVFTDLQISFLREHNDLVLSQHNTEDRNCM
ncbi:nuclear transport factor 2 family protein [Rhodopirellula sp. JC639]|uniref:nuclear transport factor 2 family protein n=1 Tax=Stieleria mannarensis TaxID=2755585 RepID=UPI0016006516|nr:nuclear transport factor 2 family protein [Rhodopirellula sp. JC639]